MIPTKPLLQLCCLLIASLALNAGGACSSTAALTSSPDSCIDSLDTLSITALRIRQYQSSPKLIAQQGDKPYPSFIASYRSDGLRLYTRVDIPVTTMPDRGYPVLIFAHGWVGIDKAPDYDFAYTEGSHYGEMIDFFVASGFVVVSPGYRGHGTVNGQTAEGVEFMQAWDNGSYLMPSFYAIDILNLMAGLKNLEQQAWQRWGFNTDSYPHLNLQHLHLLAHSQGGDAALTVMAVSGEGSTVNPPVQSASIWSGNIPDRFTQVETFGPMGSTLQAFMSGDGSWTGSSIGKRGEINPNFVFPWPSDRITTLDRSSPNWGWQEKTWALPSVEAAVRKKYQQMYSTINQFVRDTDNASFEISSDKQGKLVVNHPAIIQQKMLAIGGFNATQWLSEPLALHISDRDYYSLPAWNKDLTARINADDGKAYMFIYPGNTHSLKRSKQPWFSPAGTKAGYPYALQRDLLLFSGKDPQAINFP